MFASLHLRRPTNAFPTPPAPPIVIAGSSSSSAGPSRLHSTPLSGSSRPSHPESQSQSARPQPAQSIRPARPAEPHGAAPGTGARAVAAVKGRTREEKYFARVANENILPNKLHKGLGIGGWVLGVFALGYMALYTDFGDREHVFSPLRRQYAAFTQDLTTLSPTERSVLGLDKDASAGTSAGDERLVPESIGLGGSLRDPVRKPT